MSNQDNNPNAQDEMRMAFESAMQGVRYNRARAAEHPEQYASAATRAAWVGWQLCAQWQASQACKQCDAKQAKIDALMLEYCPNEMTKDQVTTWGASQRAAPVDLDVAVYGRPAVAMVSDSEDFAATVKWLLNPMPEGSLLYEEPTYPSLSDAQIEVAIREIDSLAMSHGLSQSQMPKAVGIIRVLLVGSAAPSDLHAAIMALPGINGRSEGRLTELIERHAVAALVAGAALCDKPSTAGLPLDLPNGRDIQRPEGKPELTVWEDSMPESNGKSNFTAVLHRKGDDGFEVFLDGYTIARSEYPDRVRYEADCVRYLIGEIAERPDILKYDADKHSDYVAPQPTAAPVVPDEWSGPWELQIDSYMARTEGVAAHVLGKEIRLEYTDGSSRWKLSLPTPTSRTKKVSADQQEPKP